MPGYFVMRTKDPNTVMAILRGSSSVTATNLNTLEREIQVGDIVFVVLGGDRPQWDLGLRAIATVSHLPPHTGRIFSAQLQIELVLPRSVPRVDFASYPDTYGTIFVAPVMTWEPNQALQRVPPGKEISLTRVLWDLFPNVERDLETILGPAVMHAASLPMRVHLPSVIPHSATGSASLATWTPSPATLSGPLQLVGSTADAVRDCLKAGHHIMLSGPPGTGKTTLAMQVCQDAVTQGVVGNYVMATATADWTTFDTIGGYMPDPDNPGQLMFTEGLVLRSIRENAWIVVDEVNRCDADKAFGPLISVLNGQGVTLPYQHNGRAVRIAFVPTPGSAFDPTIACYQVGTNWRMIATRNSFDKSTLYTLSYGLTRRFATYQCQPSRTTR